MKHVTVLGSTGSIGVNTLDVIARHPDQYQVIALTAHRQIDRLWQQIQAIQPKLAVVDREDDAATLRQYIDDAGLSTEVWVGEDALQAVAALPDADIVMAAIVGAAGLLPALAAARAGKRVLLANKEALVVSGSLFMQAVAEGGAELLPIDSEHNAIYQCLPHPYQPGQALKGVRRVLLTASGGPFRGCDAATLNQVTPSQACAHPNWDMGRKISVDSATLMNKGLELIEACWLFDLPVAQIDVHIHPESIVHSMVEYVDGSVLAQLGNPDMRTPIAYGLAWPQRLDAGVSALDLFAVAQLNFESPDHANFPCLGLAAAAMGAGGTAPAILNAANEVAVEAFLREQIAFTAIPTLIDHTLQTLAATPADSLDAVLHADQQARAVARERL